MTAPVIYPLSTVDKVPIPFDVLSPGAGYFIDLSAPSNIDLRSESEILFSVVAPVPFQIGFSFPAPTLPNSGEDNTVVVPGNIITMIKAESPYITVAPIGILTASEFVFINKIKRWSGLGRAYQYASG